MRLARFTNFAKGCIMQSLVKVLIQGQIFSIQTIQRRTYASRLVGSAGYAGTQKETPYLTKTPLEHHSSNERKAAM